jgi:diguanylate cyclase (GGDEF)-like protein/PAS domain S-box-containing protein
LFLETLERFGRGEDFELSEVGRGIRKNGETFEAEIFASPIDAGAQRLLYANMRDVSEHRRAQAAMRSRKDELEALFNALPDLYFRMRADGTILDYHACSSDELYVPPEVFLGRRIQDVLPPDLARLTQAKLSEFLATRKPMAYEYELEIQGRPTPFEARLLPLGDSGDIVTLVRNIAERRRAEQRLRQAATVFESTTEGVFITDSMGEILEINRAFTQITGYGPEEAIGKTPNLLRSGRHDESFYRRLWDALGEEGRWQGEVWNRRKNGEIYPQWLSISRVQNEPGETLNYVAVFSDISSLRHSQEQLEYLAHHDPLTDLPNRLLFTARLEHALATVMRRHKQLAVLFLDLDRFKIVNDSLGHSVGDKVLKRVAHRLASVVRHEDTVARLGGDEFIVLLEDLASASGASEVAEKLIHALEEPFSTDGHDLFLSVSVGISLAPDDGRDVDTLVRNADTAMYKAKSTGRGTYQFYESHLTATAFERVVLESHLRRALERQEFRLAYQPQVHMPSGRIVGAEALLRWEHPDMGLVMPDRFLPLLEESGLILPVGEWILDTACRQAARWRAAGLQLERLAVNLAGIQIERYGLEDVIQRLLEETGLEPSVLEIEITENLFMQDPERVVQVLDRLRALGVQIAIDDFGTGYSSLAYLKRLPIDKLKIDRSFIRDIPGDTDDEAITRAIIGLARTLRLNVIAEGVENQAMVEFLTKEGCDLAQGFRYGAPMDAATFATLLDPRSS